jgi:hypothetical protein
MPPIVIAFFLFYFLPADISFASNATVDVSATVQRINQCKFNTNDSTLDLGVLDPESPIDRTITTSLIFKCAGSDDLAVFSISSDFEGSSGGGRKMRNSSIEAYIPYNLSMNNASGVVERNMDQSLTVSINVKGADYRELYSGSYSDVVYISITP